LSYARAKK